MAVLHLRSPRSPALVGLASTGVAFLMLFAFVPGSVAALPATPTSSVGGATWAYGEVRTMTVGPLWTPDGWQYQGSATLGYSVVISQTNDTAGANTFGLAVVRAEGISVALEFCRPNCNDPAAYANLTLRAWEKAHTWANFTENATVQEGSASVPAIGILNANSSVNANLTESTFSAIRETLTGPLVDRSKYLSVSSSSSAAVAFTPALGLVPLNLLSLQSGASGANWTSESDYAASGASQASYYFAFHGPVVGNLTVGPTTVSSTYQPSGNVTIFGSFASPASVSFNGIGSFPAIRLGVVGPFSLEDGIILIPNPANFLGSFAHPWQANQASSVSAQLASVDLVPNYHGHFGLVATSHVYTLSSANPAEITGPNSSNSSPIAPDATPAGMNPVASPTVQGQPEPVATAQSNSQCLVVTTSCTSSSLPVPRAFFATAVAVVVVASAAALIAVVVIVDRRRLPPPAYPNAGLYPPGGRIGGGPVPVARAPETAEPTPEEDPLDHLW
jgi:hypothetical protein